MLTPAGKRDRLIRFMRADVAEDESGVEAPQAPTLIEKAWALVRFGTSAERREASGTNASQVATFRVLSTSKLRGVTVGDTIVDDAGVSWNITGFVAIGGPAMEIEFTAATRRAAFASVA